MYVTGGTSIEFDLSDGDGPVLGIGFDSENDEGLVVTKVQVLDGTPADVPVPNGNLYSVMSIDVGAEGTISNDNAENIMIRFKVNKEWINENNIDMDTICLMHFYEVKWQELPTDFESENEKFLYFTAETPGFSIFSIVADTASKDVSEESVQTEETVSLTSEEGQQEETDTEDTKNTPGFGVLAGIVFVSLALIVLRKINS
jgi:PGF-pre-PGF domain-containing protein